MLTTNPYEKIILISSKILVERLNMYLETKINNKEHINKNRWKRNSYSVSVYAYDIG